MPMGVGEAKAKIQDFKREFHAYIHVEHLDYVRV